VLHYQPIVSLKDGSVSHYEALVRLADEPGEDWWRPGVPARGRALRPDPGDRSDGAGPGGRAASRSQIGGPVREQDVRIAINCSSLSITDRGMLAEIEQALTRARVDPAQLVIEVTETAAISDMARAQAFCAACRHSVARSRSMTSALGSAPSNTSSTCRFSI